LWATSGRIDQGGDLGEAGLGHGQRGQHEAPAQAFDLEHRAEAGQHLGVEHALQAGEELGLGGAEAVGDLAVGLVADRKAALQGVDDAPVELVEGRGGAAGVHGARAAWPAAGGRPGPGSGRRTACSSRWRTAPRGEGGEADFGGEGLAAGGDGLAVAAVDHAEQVVGPVAVQAAAVAQADPVVAGEQVAEAADLGLGHRPHAHGVGPVAELAVLHDHAEAAQGAVGLPAGEGVEHAVSVRPAASATAW
jgi:hypothetical protein